MHRDQLRGLNGHGGARTPGALVHKTFKGKAASSKSTKGWLFGFKLYILVNDRGEIVNFALTPGNVGDRNRGVMAMLTRGVSGKRFAGLGYLRSCARSFAGRASSFSQGTGKT